MSRATALDNINLQRCDRWAHTEYSLEYHKRFLSRLTDRDPESTAALKVLYDHWQFDMLWRTNDGMRGDWLTFGRATDMGHAEYESSLREVGDSYPNQLTTGGYYKTIVSGAIQSFGLPGHDLGKMGKSQKRHG